MFNGVFIAAGEKGVRAWSENGVDWSDPIGAEDATADKNNTGSWAGGGSLWGLASGNGRVVAVGPFGGGGSIRTSSADGKDWEEMEILQGDAGRLLDVTFGNGKFVAVGSEVPNYITCYHTSSGDGTKWKEMQSVQRKDNDPDAGGLIRVHYGNDTFVGVGRGGKLAWSSDGENWTFTDKSQQLNNSLIELCHGNGIFVGVGLHGLRMTSVDGREWTDPEMGEEGEHINSIIWAERAFVGVAPGATYFSQDGKKWERVPNNLAGAGAVKIAFAKERFVGARYRGQMLTSRDGLNWEPTTKFEQDILAVEYFEGR